MKYNPLLFPKRASQVAVIYIIYMYDIYIMYYIYIIASQVAQW